MTIEHIIVLSALFRMLTILIDQSVLLPYRKPDIFGTYREWQAARRERMKSLAWLIIVFFLLHNGYISQG